MNEQVADRFSRMKLPVPKAGFINKDEYLINGPGIYALKQGVTNICRVLNVGGHTVYDASAMGRLVDLTPLEHHKYLQDELAWVVDTYTGKGWLLNNPTLLSIGQKGL
jgi:hypothetical protein